MLFWKSTASTASDLGKAADAPGDQAKPDTDSLPATALVIAPSMMALCVLAALTVMAGPVTTYLEATSAQLYDSSSYVDAVLNGNSREAK